MELFPFVGIFLLICVAIAYVIEHLRGNVVHPKEKEALKYQYTRKQFVMTQAENNFYQVLQQAVGSAYVIFPQVHLDTFLNHRTKGQNWAGALSTIQRKSVDFLICNRNYYNPLVAIELDDSSHQREDRIVRDAKVDAICKAQTCR